MPKLNTLHDLFLHELQDIASAEEQLTKALPKMAKAANDPELQAALRSHLQETEGHLEQVTQLLADFGASRDGVKCAAMAGLVSEGDDMVNQKAEPAVRDAAIIAASQKVEHYEIATYGTLKAWAELMDHGDAVDVLESILEQERAADEKLTELAAETNFDANEGDEGGPSDDEAQTQPKAKSESKSRSEPKAKPERQPEPSSKAKRAV